MLRVVLVALAIGTVIGCAAAVGRDVLYARIGAAVPNDLRRQLFGQLQRLPTHFYAVTLMAQVAAATMA